MKTKNFLNFKTLNIAFPTGRTFLFAILLIPILILAIELFLRLVPIPSSLLVPTIDGKINYPEIDIKLSRLAVLGRENKINCFLLGNSMVDFGLNPSILNKQSNIMGIQNPSCFNMALEAMMPETISDIVGILKRRFSPALIIIGISPIDFAGGDYITRNFGNSPWFLYQAGINSPEGWLIENSQSYKYWLAFKKYRSPEYSSDIKNQSMLIDTYGFQIRETDNKIFQVQQSVKFPDFSLAKNDFAAFKDLMSDPAQKARIIVIEMPVHPDFLPYYVSGGEKGYEDLFIHPIQMVLDKESIPFIRTQSQIMNIVTPDGWIDNAHLNEKGAEQFSSWLAYKLGNYSGNPE